MSADWKPGDLAMVTLRSGEERRCARTFNDTWEHFDERSFAWNDEDITSARPLVVIDPVAITGPDETGHDADPLEEIALCLRRLAEAEGANATNGSYRGRVAARLANVFEESIAPRIDEPPGLGAVVVDRFGVRWVRASMRTTVNHWRCADESGVGRKPFARIEAVEVLSEGVTS